MYHEVLYYSINDTIKQYFTNEKTTNTDNNLKSYIVFLKLVNLPGIFLHRYINFNKKLKIRI